MDDEFYETVGSARMGIDEDPSDSAASDAERIIVPIVGSGRFERRRFRTADSLRVRIRSSLSETGELQSGGDAVAKVLRAQPIPGETASVADIAGDLTIGIAETLRESDDLP